MRNSVLSLATLLALVLAGPARAQEGLGLDLSGETSTPQEEQDSGGEDSGSTEPLPEEGLGLQIDPGVDTALLPRFALVGLEATERIGAPAWRQWTTLLRGAALRTGKVSAGADPRESLQALESNYQEVLRCDQADCLRDPAETLDADLLTVARLSKEGRTWTLRLITYDRDRAEVEVDEVSGKSPRDKRFLRQGATTLAQRLQALARPRALLKVKTNLAQAVVRMGDRILGAGSVEVRLPPGPVSLTVEADGFDSVNRSLELAPGEVKEVETPLIASGPEPEGPPDERKGALAVRQQGPSGPSLFTRPGFYTTLVGLVAAGVGVALNLQAQSALARAQDSNGDGVVDITRANYLQARGQASLSTALMAGGGAVAGAGVLWLVLVPTSAPASASAAPANPQAGGTAFHLVMGGSF